MPNIEITKTDHYELVNGIPTLTQSIESVVEVPTQEEMVAEKEQELLKIYNEIQKLKLNI